MVLNEIISNTANQILVYPHIYPKVKVQTESYENQKILKVTIPEINN